MKIVTEIIFGIIEKIDIFLNVYVRKNRILLSSSFHHRHPSS